MAKIYFYVEKGHKAVASVGVMGDEGKSILMGKRRSNGRWTLPGGHLNEGEKPHAGAKRELHEEAGIKTKKLKHLGSEDITTHTGKKLTIHAYTVNADGQKPTSKNDPDEEVAKWEMIDVTNGLPEHVASNLHSPKNVVLMKLGIQKGFEISVVDRVLKKIHDQNQFFVRLMSGMAKSDNDGDKGKMFGKIFSKPKPNEDKDQYEARIKEMQERAVKTRQEQQYDKPGAQSDEMDRVHEKEEEEAAKSFSYVIDLVKAGSHKYLRKYMRGGKWIYIYHEGDRTHRVSEEHIGHIKELAELGDEHAKALHDTLQPHDEEKLKILRELADLGNKAAHKTLKSHGIDREKEKLEEQLIPVAVTHDPIDQHMDAATAQKAKDIVARAVKTKVFTYLAGHTSNPYSTTLASGGVTHEKLVEAISGAKTLGELLVAMNKQMNKIDAAHRGLPPSANSEAKDAGGYANLAYKTAVKDLETANILPAGYGEIHKRNGKGEITVHPIRELQEKLERKRREAEEQSRRELGEYASKVSEVESYYSGRSLSPADRVAVGKGIKRTFGSRFSMKSFLGHLNTDETASTKIDVSEEFLNHLIRAGQGTSERRGGSLSFQFQIKDRRTGELVTSARREVSFDEDGVLTWHNHVFARPSNELLRKHSGMSTGVYGGVENFLKEVTADLPTAAKKKCSIYMGCANDGFTDGYKGALIWAKHYFDFDNAATSRDRTKFKGIWDSALINASVRLPSLAIDLNTVRNKVNNFQYPFEFVKLGIPVTKEQAVAFIGRRLDFDFTQMFARNPTVDLGELIMVQSGEWWNARNYFNGGNDRSDLLNGKRTAYYQRSGRGSGGEADTIFAHPRIAEIVDRKWGAPKGRNIVLTARRLTEIGTWTREEVKDFHAKASLTRAAKRRVEEILNRLGG